MALLVEIILAVCVVAFALLFRRRKVDVQFGILGVDEGGDGVATETLELPFELRDKMRFGLMFYVGKDVKFAAQVIHYLPACPKALCGSIENIAPVKTARGFMVAGPVEQYVHGGVRAFGFSEGDPLGNYELDLLVDGKRVKTVKYRVIASHAQHQV